MTFFIRFVHVGYNVFAAIDGSREGATGPWPNPKALKVPFGSPNEKFLTMKNITFYFGGFSK